MVSAEDRVVPFEVVSFVQREFLCSERFRWGNALALLGELLECIGGLKVVSNFGTFRVSMIETFQC